MRRRKNKKKYKLSRINKPLTNNEKIMNAQQQREALENLLYKCNLPKKYFLKKDEINGKTFALASTGENDSINVHSNFMTYSEMKAYLFGLYDGLNKKFK